MPKRGIFLFVRLIKYNKVMEENYDKSYWNDNKCPKYDCRKNSCKCGLKNVFLPTVLGDDSEDSPIAPKKGAYCNAIVTYEANGHIYIYTSEGIPVLVSSETSEPEPKPEKYNLNYSTSEINTGMVWLDGKKIYKKTINTYELPPNGASNSIPHGINNLGKVIKIEGYAEDSTDGKWINIPSYSQLDSAKAIVSVDVTGNEINVVVPSDSLPMDSFGESYTTIYYTKGN